MPQSPLPAPEVLAAPPKFSAILINCDKRGISMAIWLILAKCYNNLRLARICCLIKAILFASKP